MRHPKRRSHSRKPPQPANEEERRHNDNWPETSCLRRYWALRATPFLCGSTGHGAALDLGLRAMPRCLLSCPRRSQISQAVVSRITVVNYMWQT